MTSRKLRGFERFVYCATGLLVVVLGLQALDLLEPKDVEAFGGLALAVLGAVMGVGAAFMGANYGEHKAKNGGTAMQATILRGTPPKPGEPLAANASPRQVVASAARRRRAEEVAKAAQEQAVVDLADEGPADEEPGG